MAESEWSNLPTELLEHISRRLSSEIDLLRFRSVCPTWRSAVRTLSSHPSRFPILPAKEFSLYPNTGGIVLSKRTIYCIKRPLSDQSSWIIKLEHDSHDRMLLLNPFITECPFPDILPKFFDFWNLQIVELGCGYTIHETGEIPCVAIFAGDIPRVAKVAFYFDIKDGVCYVLDMKCTAYMAMYKSSDTKWTFVDYPLQESEFFEDVIFYCGNFYAVTRYGNMVVVNLDSSGCPFTSLVAGPIYDWEEKVVMKFLVESCGDLLLVNMCMTVGIVDDDGFVDVENRYKGMDCFKSERGDKLEVFRLDITRKCWDEVSSLGDRILFLGYDDCTFSASVSELSFMERGNCILFSVDMADGHKLFKNKMKAYDEDWISRVGVFDMEDGSFGPLSSYPGYSEAFWPPPTWIYPTLSVEASDALV